MSKMVACPFDEYNQVDANGAPLYYVALPEKWLGLHAQRYEKAISGAKDKGWAGIILEFGVALALLDDWHIPGLPKNPEAWDFTALEIRIMVWVKQTVLPAYQSNFYIPKAS